MGLFCCSTFFFLWHCLFLILLSRFRLTQSASQNPIPAAVINIGAILDSNSTTGKIAQQALQLAVNDINADNSVLNSSKIVLQTLESNSKPFQGFAAAIQLLKGGVVAIAGPQTSTVAHFVADIAGAAQVPLVSFGATDPALSQNEYPYFFRTTPNDALQMTAIASVVHYHGWREVLALYSDDEYLANGITSLGDALNNVGARILCKAALARGISKSDMGNVLRNLSKMESRIFVVHVSQDIGLTLFAEANFLGIMSAGYAWIVTESTMDALNIPNMDSNALKSVGGIIGVRSHIPDSPRRQDFETEWNKYQAKQTNRTHLNAYGMYAYDSMWMIAHAVDSFLNQGGSFNFENPTHQPCDSGRDCELTQLKVLKEGPLLRQLLLQTKFNGTLGLLQVDIKGELLGSIFEVVNVVGNATNVIGYWKNESGILTSLPGNQSVTKNESGELTSVLGNQSVSPIPSLAVPSANRQFNIVWPGGSKEIPRPWALSKSGTPLRIAVPHKTDYPQILSVSAAHNSWSFQGFCIDVFNAALKQLPYKVPYKFIAYGNGKSNPNYTAMIELLANQEVDAVVGDVTVRAARLELADFTQPYKESGLVVVIPVKDGGSSNAFNFLRPFTPAVWCITGAFFVFTGVVVWSLEHGVNPEFNGPPKMQIVTLLWFSFSTLYFGQRENTKSFLGRVVVIIWLFIVLIITSAYTANLTSILTVQQLTPTIKGISSLQASNVPIGYQTGSFVRDYLLSLKIAPNRLKGYTAMESLAVALTSGPDNGGVAALVEELPYVQVFLSSHCGFTIAGQEFTRGGWGFAFQKGSQLAIDFSTALLTLSESSELQKLNDFWLGKPLCDSKRQAQLNQIGLRSFWGPFVITGVTSVTCLIAYIARMLWKYNQAGKSYQHANFIVSFLKYLTEPVEEDEELKRSQRKRKRQDGIDEII